MSSDLIAYFIFGGCWVVAILVLVRINERLWLAPSAIFFIGFFFHGFVAPYVELTGVRTILDPSNLDYVLRQTCYSAAALLLGYSLVQVVAQRGKIRLRRDRVTPLAPVFRRTGVAAAIVAMLFVWVTTFGVLILSGRLEAQRGTGAYDGGTLRQLAAVGFAIYALVPALVMSRFQAPDRRSAIVTACAWLSMIAVAAFSVLQFARFTIAYVAAVVFMHWHTRVRRVRFRWFALLGAGVVLLSVFSQARSLREGIVNVSPAELLSFLANRAARVTDVAYSLARSLPGQGVFTQTVNFVPGIDDYFHGTTYLRSFLALFMPNAITGSYDFDTPAYWFREMYAPGLMTQGYDFSMMAEAYMNFGDWMSGVFLLVGAAVAGLSNAVRKSNSPMLVLWAALCIINLTFGLRNDSNSLFVRATYFILPALGLSALNRVRFRISPAPVRTAGVQAPDA